MPGPFEKEIEALAQAHTEDFARKLAHEVSAFILRKLGVETTGSSPVVASRAVKATAPSKAPAGRAAPPKAPAAAEKPASPPAAAKAPAAPKKPVSTPAKAAAATAKSVAAPATKPARRRSSGSDMAAIVGKVLQIVTSSNGASASDVVTSSGLAAAPVAAALKALRAEGRIYMGGDRRFARYAGSQAAADRASLAARKG